MHKWTDGLRVESASPLHPFQWEYGASAHFRLKKTQAAKKGFSMAKQKLKRHVIDRQWCKGCGICVRFCPKHVLELDDEEKARAVRVEDCIGCKLCEMRCPDLSITIETEEQEGVELP
jgi:2-oxoglutarate ferredoxin oxidoreductase subunit delta